MGGQPVAAREEAPAARSAPSLLEARGIAKSYGAIEALRGVSLAVRPGQVVGLVGDNGAGKSTLIRILAGAEAPTGGELLVGGAPASLASPLQARQLGIETVHQGLALAPNLTVMENIYLGRELVQDGWRRRISWLDGRRMRREGQEHLAQLGIRLPSLTTPCQFLSGGQRQAVAIARALTFRPQVLLLDEPTAALGVQEQRKVGELITRVSQDGIGVVLISHNMRSVHELCDEVVVLFQGADVAHLERDGRDVNEIVRWITGAALQA